MRWWRFYWLHPPYPAVIILLAIPPDAVVEITLASPLGRQSRQATAAALRLTARRPDSPIPTRPAPSVRPSPHRPLTTFLRVPQVVYSIPELNPSTPPRSPPQHAPSGRGDLFSCGDVEPNPGPKHATRGPPPSPRLMLAALMSRIARRQPFSRGPPLQPERPVPEAMWEISFLFIGTPRTP